MQMVSNSYGTNFTVVWLWFVLSQIHFQFHVHFFHILLIFNHATETLPGTIKVLKPSLASTLSLLHHCTLTNCPLPAANALNPAQLKDGTRKSRCVKPNCKAAARGRPLEFSIRNHALFVRTSCEWEWIDFYEIKR